MMHTDLILNSQAEDLSYVMFCIVVTWNLTGGTIENDTLQPL